MTLTFTRNLGPAEQLILKTARRQWRIVAINLGASVLEAFGEGASLTLVFMAVQVLSSSGKIQWVTNPMVGRFQGLVAWLSTVPSTQLVLALLGAAVLVQLLQSALRYLVLLSAGFLSARCRALITAELHAQILRLSYPCASAYRVGDLTDVIVAGPEGVARVIQASSQLLLNLLLVVVYVGVLVLLSPWLLLMAAGLAALVAAIQTQLLPRIGRQARRVSAAQMATAVRITEDIQGLRLLHSSGQLERARSRIHNEVDVLDRSLRRQTVLEEIIGPVNQLLPVLAIAVIGAASLQLFALKSSGVLPSLVTFVLALQRLNVRLGSVARIATDLSANAGRLSRLNGLLRDSDKTFCRTGGKLCPPLRCEVRLEAVQLRYSPEGPPVLRGIDLVIPRGRTVALVGPSGAGKSSVADLLLGLYEPSAGRVLVDGHDLQELDLASWRQTIGVVSQDTFLLNASVAANVAFSRPDAPLAEIQAACRAAQCAVFIEQLPDGYDTLIGERGYRLSGGQRQRLALARALLAQPQLLILDEATSALDSRNERLVQLAIERLTGERTILVIAHRLSTVAKADQIVVLQEGRILECGSHSQLLAQGGLYAELWREQSQQSDRDPLTGTWNQRHTLDVLERHLMRTRRYGVPISLIALALEDHQPATPPQLQALAEAVGRRLRETDQLGSLGDGRLLLMLPHTNEAEAHSFLVSLQRHLEQILPEFDGRNNLILAVVSYDAQESMAELLQRLERSIL